MRKIKSSWIDRIFDGVKIKLLFNEYSTRRGFVLELGGKLCIYFYQDDKHFKYDGWSTDVSSTRELFGGGMAMFDKIKAWSIKKFKEKKHEKPLKKRTS